MLRQKLFSFYHLMTQHLITCGFVTCSHNVLLLLNVFEMNNNGQVHLYCIYSCHGSHEMEDNYNMMLQMRQDTFNVKNDKMSYTVILILVIFIQKKSSSYPEKFNEYVDV